jgi:hypothetical protein
VLLTWLRGLPIGDFAAASAVLRGGEPLTLPGRTVARAVVPAGADVVRAGRDLFDWIARRGMDVCGPTLEERLVDGDGATATILEIPIGSPGPNLA